MEYTKAMQDKVVQMVLDELGPMIITHFEKALWGERAALREEFDKFAEIERRLRAIEAMQDKAVRKILADLPPIARQRRAEYVQPEPRSVSEVSTVNSPGWDMETFAKGLAQLAKQFEPADAEKAFAGAIDAIKEKTHE